MPSKKTIPLAIAFGGIIIAGAIYLSAPKKSAVPLPTPKSSLMRPVSSADHILGNPNAKVVIVEYSDFDCEYCKGFNVILHRIILQTGASGQVAWVFRQFPITEIHPYALKHAEASECAGKVGGEDAFWKFADILFDNQPINPSDYGTFAKQIGLSGTAFAQCYSDAKNTVDERIMADRQNAIAIGAPGAPYSLIVTKGQEPTIMYGAYAYNAVKALIDQAIASASK